MRSSGSTPSPSGRRVPRLLLHFVGDDDPRVCTGARLVRRGFAVRAPEPGHLVPPPIVLDPYAPRPLSVADRSAALRGGILVIDCSWNRLAAAGRLAGAAAGRSRGRTARRLPFLLATNPQHFGRLGQLNTAEALAAALIVLGFPEAGSRVLDGLRGGPAFFEVNRAVFERLGSARSAEEVVAAEREVYGGAAGVAGDVPSDRAPSTSRPR